MWCSWWVILLFLKCKVSRIIFDPVCMSNSIVFKEKRQGNDSCIYAQNNQVSSIHSGVLQEIAILWHLNELAININFALYALNTSPAWFFLVLLWEITIFLQLNELISVQMLQEQQHLKYSPTQSLRKKRDWHAFYTAHFVLSLCFLLCTRSYKLIVSVYLFFK